MSSRKNQRQLWADNLFLVKLEEIRVERLKRGLKVNNLGELTKEIVDCPSFKDVEKELINKINRGLNVKFDKIF